jgi:hypothetical protein
MATKSYQVGPQDGWFKIVTAGLLASLRVSVFPHTHPFFIYGDPTATPSLTADNGVLVCHHPFKITAGDRKNADAFFVRIKNPLPGSTAKDGRVRIDVYTDGGTLV